MDGSKLKANASLEANRTYEHIAQEVKKMLDEADAKDSEEDRLYGPRTSGAEGSIRNEARLWNRSSARLKARVASDPLCAGALELVDMNGN